MSYSVQYPSETLAPYIKLYWAMDGNVDKGAEHLQRIVPTGLADLIFYFDDLPENIVRNDATKSRSVINGQQTNYYDLKVTGRINLLSVCFTPQGTRQFFNLPINEIQNKNLPLKFLIGNIADEIEEKLFEKFTFAERVNVLEKFMIKKLGEKRAYEFKRMDNTIRSISRPGGVTNIGQLANGACLSRKQFERSFSGHIGLTPKQFLRVVRFQKAILYRQKMPGISLTQIAYHSGFSDQSHMVREFVRISGMSPGKYFSSCDPVSDYFS